MSKKKIVFYYPDMYVGGVEMAILNLAKRIYKDYDLYFFYRTYIISILVLTAYSLQSAQQITTAENINYFKGYVFS